MWSKRMAQLEARSEPKARAYRSDDHKVGRPDQPAIKDPGWINPERAPHSQAAIKPGVCKPLITLTLTIH